MIFFSQFLLDDALSTWLRDESIQLENERTGATVATLIASTLWQYIPHHKRRSWSLSSRAQEMKCHSPYKISSEPHPHRQNWFSNLIRCLLLSPAALTFKFQKDGKSYSHTQISDSSQRVMAHVEQFLWLNRQPSQRLGKFQSFHFTELFPSSFPRPIETGASCPVLFLLIVYSNVMAHIRWKKKELRVKKNSSIVRRNCARRGEFHFLISVSRRLFHKGIAICCYCTYCRVPIGKEATITPPPPVGCIHSAGGSSSVPVSTTTSTERKKKEDAEFF